MFGFGEKTSRRLAKTKEIQRTEWFAVEVLRAILEERLGKRIYFTQTDVDRFQGANGLDSVRVTVRTLFTGIDDSERYGCEGVFPIYPSAYASIELVNHETNVMLWQIQSVHLGTMHVDGPIHAVERTSRQMTELKEVQISEEVKTFAKKLLRRGPAIAKHYFALLPAPSGDGNSPSATSAAGFCFQPATCSRNFSTRLNLVCWVDRL